MGWTPSPDSDEEGETGELQREQPGTTHWSAEDSVVLPTPAGTKPPVPGRCRSTYTRGKQGLVLKHSNSQARVGRGTRPAPGTL